jgi:hypothetical protein
MDSQVRTTSLGRGVLTERLMLAERSALDVATSAHEGATRPSSPPSRLPCASGGCSRARKLCCGETGEDDKVKGRAAGCACARRVSHATAPLLLSLGSSCPTAYT